MQTNRKPIPKSLLIFGAGARLGGPLATFMQREAPQVQLRLVTSKPDNVAALQQRHPQAEVVVADYLDLPSLRHAATGMEAVFTLTGSSCEERPAMGHLVTALQEAGTVVHVIRLLGLQPEANPRRIPQSLRAHGRGLPIQHPIAKQILDESGLPVTYLNIGATFMDNFLLWMDQGLRRDRTLVWPERLIPYVDPRDVAEAAGRLFLSDNHRHLGQFHTVNNGQDLLRFHEVAALMSEVWQTPIGHDGSQAAFFQAYAPFGAKRLQYLWDFFQYEQDNEVVWAPNTFLERTLGRRPVSLRDWLAEHRLACLGDH